MLRNRLLAIGIFLFATGCSGGVLLSDRPVLFLALCAGMLCVCLCAVVFFNRNYAAIRLRTAAALCVLPIVGMVYALAYGVVFHTPYDRYDGETFVFTAAVAEKSSGSLDLNVCAGNDLAEGTAVRIYTDDAESYSYGEIVSCEAVLSPSHARKRQSLLADGIVLFSYATPQHTNGFESGVFVSLRRLAADSASAGSETASSVVRALTVGDRSALSDEITSLLSRSGISHLLAVSGMHLALLVMTIYGFLALLGLGRRPRCIFCAALALFYGALTGFSPSASRAVFMLLMFLAANAFFFAADNFTSLFAALGVLVLFNPYALCSLSLQLSFSATFGILCAAPWMDNHLPKRKIPRLLWTLLVTPMLFSLTAILFTLPFAVLSLDTISLSAPIANIAAAILFPPLLLGSFLLVIMPFASVILEPCFSFLLNSLLAVCRFLDGFSRLCLSTSLPGLSAAAGAAGLGIASVLLLRKKPRTVACIVSLCLIVLCVSGGVFVRHSESRRQAVLTYGEGYTARFVLIADGNDACYLDCGGNRLDKSAIYENGLTSVAVFVFSDYIHAAEKCASACAFFRPQTLYFPEPQTEEEAVLFASLQSDNSSCRVLYYTDALRLSVGKSTVFMTPQAILNVRENESALFCFGNDRNDLFANFCVLTQPFAAAGISPPEADSYACYRSSRLQVQDAAEFTRGQYVRVVLSDESSEMSVSDEP